MEATLTGLAPDKNYFYSVGGIVSPDQEFRTTPNSNKTPADGNTHILIVGDSGTQPEASHVGKATRVLTGYNAYNAANGGEAVDVFLALGDNAYVSGTDAQWQTAFFEIYPKVLKCLYHHHHRQS
jgi:phosphodiesterase/alkaline phosphatase D-like protein